MTEREKINAFIEDLAKDFKPTVKAIESGPELTQKHYGKYMSIFGQFNELLGKEPENTKRCRKLVTAALIVAGANEQGVRAALKVYGD
tara:strand:- start:178 stop:441 length:264 start_codon:yes stop_codon:yes gene_type:complete